MLSSTIITISSNIHLSTENLESLLKRLEGLLSSCGNRSTENELGVKFPVCWDVPSRRFGVSYIFILIPLYATFVLTYVFLYPDITIDPERNKKGKKKNLLSSNLSINQWRVMLQVCAQSLSFQSNPNGILSHGITLSSPDWEFVCVGSECRLHSGDNLSIFEEKNLSIFLLFYVHSPVTRWQIQRSKIKNQTPKTRDQRME